MPRPLKPRPKQALHDSRNASSAATSSGGGTVTGMTIGFGTLVVILLIVLIVYFLRRA